MIYNNPRDLTPTAGKAPKNAAKNIPEKPQKQKKNKARAVKNVAFFATLYLGTFVAFIIPLRPTYSETEKRELKKFPTFSIETLKSGSYFDDITTWFSDTFPFREELTKLNTSISKLYGITKVDIHGDVNTGDDIPDVPLPQEDTTAPESTTLPPEPSSTEEQTTLPPTTEKPTEGTTKKPQKTQTMGAILVAGNSGYEYYNFSSSLAARFIKPVNNIKNCTDGKANIYTLLIPTSIDIVLDDNLRKDVASSDQKKATDYFYSSFKGVTPVTGIYESLRAHRDEYIYFRTDHHWTALGAYYAYEQFASAKGISPVPLSSYKTKTFEGFLGTFYSSSGQSSALAKTPDSVTAYLPINDASMKFTQSDGQVVSWPIIANVDDYNSGGKYLTFTAGDQPYEIIENHDLSEGQTCLIIKESYGNAFIPFLIPHYKTIHVIDPRHYNGTLSAFLKENHVDDIIFLANMSTTRNSIYIDAMTDFIK